MEPIWYVIFVIVFLMLFITLLLGTIAQRKVNEIIQKYSGTRSQCGIKGGELSTVLISRANISIDIDEINSRNTNYFSSKYKVLKLSTKLLESDSLIALAKCSQEIGNAIQDNNKNFLYRLKTNFLTIIKVLTSLFFPIEFIGFLIRFTFNINTLGLIFALTGIFLLVLIFIFFLLTYRVENKSSELISEILDTCKFFTEDELFALKDILYINAWVYIYNLPTYLLFFLNFLSITQINYEYK